MVKIRILRNTVCGGQPVDAGQVVEASDNDARLLVAMGKAEYVKDTGEIRVIEQPERAELLRGQKRSK